MLLSAVPKNAITHPDEVRVARERDAVFFAECLVEQPALKLLSPFVGRREGEAMGPRDDVGRPHRAMEAAARALVGVNCHDADGVVVVDELRRIYRLNLQHGDGDARSRARRHVVGAAGRPRCFNQRIVDDAGVDLVKDAASSVG